MCTLYSFFSSRPSEVRLILKSPKCCTIQHKFVPARSVERNIEKIRFPWASNSKFVIFSQIFPRSNYKICPIIPRLFPISNGDSPVSTTFPRSNYRGFFTTGESYCTMYTLCIVWSLLLQLKNSQSLGEVDAMIRQTNVGPGSVLIIFTFFVFIHLYPCPNCPVHSFLSFYPILSTLIRL